MVEPVGDVAKTKAAYHHGDLRAALLSVAFYEVDQSGPENISINALAKTLGVSQPAPYRHFADRDALLMAVAIEGFRVFIDALTEAEASQVARHSGRLAALCRAYVQFGRDHGGLYRLMFGSRLLSRAEPNGDLSRIARESFGILEAAMSARSTPAATRRAALGIWASLHGLVLLDQERFLSGILGDGLSMDDLLQDLVDGAATRTSQP